MDRQWVVTAYALAFGSLLLLGGRLADLLGRKVTFLTGLVGFAVASAVGGAATSFGMLVAARACQGALARCWPFGAVAADHDVQRTKERARRRRVRGIRRGGAVAWCSADC